MMKIKTEISLDLARNTMPITLFAKQFDNDTREIVITPLDRGQPYILEDGITARLQIKKPDDTQVINDAAIAGGKITAELTQQALAAAGLATAEIGLYKGETLLTSQTFYIDIMPAAYDPEKVESTDEYNSLLQATAAAEKATAEAEKWKNVTAGIEAVAPESDPEITLSDTEDGKHFDFKIPRGQKGDKGEQGEQGAKGDKGEKGDKGDPGEGVSIVQETGDSTEDVMSQKAVTDALNEHKGVNVVQETGESETDVMSQKAVTEALKSGGGTSINVVQATGDSTEDVMSQNAVTVAIEASHGSGNVITESVNAHADGQENTINNSDYATANGYKNSLDASEGGIACGSSNQVSNSENGVALGEQNSVQRSANGTAIGVNNQVSDGNNVSTAIGDTNIIGTSTNSVAIGSGNTITGGERNVALGSNNTVRDLKAVYTMGGYNRVLNSGNDSSLSADCSIIGYNNFVSTDGKIFRTSIVGDQNSFGATSEPCTLTGCGFFSSFGSFNGAMERLFVLGYYNHLIRTNYSVIVGNQNNTNQHIPRKDIENAYVFGSNNVINASSCVVIGVNNKTEGAGIYPILVGNGLISGDVGNCLILGNFNRNIAADINQFHDSIQTVIGCGQGDNARRNAILISPRKIYLNNDVVITGNLEGYATQEELKTVAGNATFISANCTEGIVTVTETSGHGDKNSTFDAAGSITLYDGENKGNGYQWYLGWKTSVQENSPAIRGFVTKGGTKFVFGDVISPIGTPVDIKSDAGDTLGTVVIDEEYNLKITIEGADDTLEATGFITSFRQ